MADTRRSMSPYPNTSGPPTSKARGDRLWQLEHSNEVAHHVGDRDRLGSGLHPARHDQGWQPLPIGG
jgi:hypothetical protein